MTAVEAERGDAARQTRRSPPLVRLAIDPFAISAIALAVSGVAVAVAGPSLPALTIAAALLAGWSSAWSP